MQEERFKRVGGFGNIGQHFTGRRPRGELVEHVLHQFTHDLRVEGLFNACHVDHRPFEPVHQALVLGDQAEFTTNVVRDHQMKALRFGVVKQNVVEPIRTHHRQIGFKDEVHALEHLLHQGVDEHVRVHDHQRLERKVVEETTF